jgi:hypothetical protein
MHVYHSSHMHRTYAFRGREEEDLLLAEHLAQYVVERVLVTWAFGPWGEREGMERKEEQE